MFNKYNEYKNRYMLEGKFAKQGYDWWWHSFTGIAPDGSEQPFFIEFFVVNPKLSPDKVVLGQDKNGLPSYLMVKCGAWGKKNKKQLHTFIPVSEAKIGPLEYVETKDFYLDEKRTKGSCKVVNPTPAMMSDEGEMSWDLEMEKVITYNVGYGTSKLFTKLKAFEMYWHAQGIKTLFSGTVTLDGVTYKVEKETSYGYSDKNWGSNFTSPWVWLSSWNVTRKSTGEKLNNTVFDIGGGKPKAFGIRFNRKLLGAYYIEGKEYEYNFSKFLHPSKTEFGYELKDGYIHWYVMQSNRKSKIITRIKCKLEDMLFINYESPDGKKRYTNLYNGGNGEGSLEIYHKVKGEYQLVDELLVKNVGCEYGEFDPE